MAQDCAGHEIRSGFDHLRRDNSMAPPEKGQHAARENADAHRQDNVLLGRKLPGEKMRRLLLACMVGACTTMHTGAPADTITPVIEHYAAERDFSGVTLIAEANGVREFEDARGLADRNVRLAITRDTRFQIASISKLFVAVAVLREVDRGRLALDASIGVYVPHLPPRLSRITIASLMGHTSGLRRDSNFSADEALTVAEHIARLTDDELQFPAGQYVYSNTGYVLLARAVEIVSGRPFDVALREEVLAPAGLSDTDFIVGETVIPGLAIGYARGPEGWRTPPRARHRGVYPPGGLYSTAYDLARFMEVLVEGRLLSEQSTRALFEPRMPTGEGNQIAAYAGVISAHNGDDYLLVAGSADGGKAVLMRAMHAGRTIVILSNVGDVPITEMLRDVVIAAEGGVPAFPAPCQLWDEAYFVDRAGRYDFTGTGLERLNGADRFVVGLVTDGDRAFFWDAQDDSMTLLCERSTHVLTPSYTDDVRMSFEGGDMPVMVLDWDGQTFRAPRQPLP